MRENAVEQQHPDVAQNDAADQVRHEEHRTENVRSLDRLGEHVGDEERDHVDHDRGDDRQQCGEAQRVQEFLVLQCAGVVLKPYELGVGNRCELAKAQVDAHDEWNDESNNECGERWQRKQRPPFPYRLASHADHSLPAFFLLHSEHRDNVVRNPAF